MTARTTRPTSTRGMPLTIPAAGTLPDEIAAAIGDDLEHVVALHAVEAKARDSVRAAKGHAAEAEESWIAAAAEQIGKGATAASSKAVQAARASIEARELDLQAAERAVALAERALYDRLRAEAADGGPLDAAALTVCTQRLGRVATAVDELAEALASLQHAATARRWLSEPFLVPPRPADHGVDAIRAKVADAVGLDAWQRDVAREPEAAPAPAGGPVPAGAARS